MKPIVLVISFVPLALLGYFLFDFIREFGKTPGSTWDRILAAGKGSATVAWSRFVAILGLAGAAAASCADYLGAPGVGDAVKAAIADHPNLVLAFTVAVPLVTEWARRRTL